MPLPFELAAGSVAGRDHRKGVPTNRQDDFCLTIGESAITALVSDGCGSGKRSEVGASLAIRLFSSSLNRQLSDGRPCTPKVLKRSQQDVLAYLHILAREMGESFVEVISNYFLFTIIGVVITTSQATFFALGDGLVIVNDKYYELEPEAGNQPLYLSYALTGSKLTEGRPDLLDFQIVAELPAKQLEHFLIGSDGVVDLSRSANHYLPGLDQTVGSLEQFWLEDKYFRNPAAIERQLNLAARDWPRLTADHSTAIEGGLLHDDTTLVVGRTNAQP